MMLLDVGAKADVMAKRNRRLGDRSDETLLYTFSALDAIDYLGAKIDAQKVVNSVDILHGE